ncbi:HdeD family acid-resistance protein [Microbacterium sp. NPDC058342]|uniref:HdeD family acid-resistance protein n=1 Tax=Microbacterium sp. NPDC058342 TaxID=3346454 RepID=UPI00364BE232
MSVTSTDAKGFFSVVRTTLAVSGVIMLLLGLFILVWPAKTAMFFAGIIAVYLIVQGLVYVGTGVFSRTDGGWSRIGHVVLGLVYVVGGVLAFVNLFAFTATLVLFIGVLLGITWIVDGVVSLSLLGHGKSRLWTILYAALSIVAGVVLLFSPFYVAIFWWLTGIALVVLGIVQIVRAIMLRRDAAVLAAALNADGAV